MSASTIDDIAQQLPLSDGVELLVDESSKSKVKTAIVSGGFTPFVEHLKYTMNLYEVRANHLEVENSHLTGKLAGDIVDAGAKAIFVNQLTNQLDITVNDVITIGDGANDLMMMKESGFSLAYKAKPAVQEKAKGRMNFTNLSILLLVFDW